MSESATTRVQDFIGDPVSDAPVVPRAKLEAINRAERTIEAMYYIYGDDYTSSAFSEALLRAADSVKKGFGTLEGDEKTGAQIILRSLEEPLRQLAEGDDRRRH